MSRFRVVSCAKRWWCFRAGQRAVVMPIVCLCSAANICYDCRRHFMPIICRGSPGQAIALLGKTIALLALLI